ncbi:MAG: 4-(cytidine 5'-diphospho)-2-C-methyl-D-erythritol kinase [Opitutaceae bacterium]|nr:4-(cytidine 5'-diphospho)-2-C-methyl-D-erythritol kinase [Opitutaceae bacterium]
MRLTSPAKVNLFLAITERRPDGFHNLLSVASTLVWGDEIEVEVKDSPGFELICSHPEVPTDESNLVLRAARAFQARAGGRPLGVRFILNKVIPVGAGLGGGSGNAVAALRALNALHGDPLDSGTLAEIASSLGSDCVLFLSPGPLVMRGRGEKTSPLPPAAEAALRGKPILIFKPGFGINTAWAYREMEARAPALYLPPEAAEARLERWTSDPEQWAELLFNNMETVAFEKYVALPTLLAKLRTQFALPCGMSGSGSACFALLREDTDREAVATCIRDAWGPEALLIESKIA